VAADFTQFNFSTGTFGTAHPDFEGDQMFFGLGQLTNFGVNKVNFRGIYDNLTFTINPVSDSGTTILLLSASVALLLLYRTLSFSHLKDCLAPVGQVISPASLLLPREITAP
jgi:hypothetical protein